VDSTHEVERHPEFAKVGIADDCSKRNYAPRIEAVVSNLQTILHTSVHTYCWTRRGEGQTGGH